MGKFDVIDGFNIIKVMEYVGNKPIENSDESAGKNLPCESRMISSVANKIGGKIIHR